MIDSLMERWLRKHLPIYEDYPEHDAPIGHNYGYHMVPFLPIYRNIEYLLSKNLGYEYDYLQDLAASEIDVAVWSDWTDWSECMLPGLGACTLTSQSSLTTQQHRSQRQPGPAGSRIRSPDSWTASTRCSCRLAGRGPCGSRSCGQWERWTRGSLHRLADASSANAP